MSDAKQKKHAGGRPTKYTPELLKKAHEYVDGAWQEDDAVPMIVGLALYCDISKQRVYEWMKDPKKKEFRDLAKKVEALQEKYLAKGGLSNDFNANITKLLLSKHGYSDKAIVDHTSTDGSMSPTKDLTDEELRAKLEDLGVKC